MFSPIAAASSKSTGCSGTLLSCSACTCLPHLQRGSNRAGTEVIHLFPGSKKKKGGRHHLIKMKQVVEQNKENYSSWFHVRNLTGVYKRGKRSEGAVQRCAESCLGAFAIVAFLLAEAASACAAVACWSFHSPPGPEDRARWFDTSR